MLLGACADSHEKRSDGQSPEPAAGAGLFALEREGRLQIYDVSGALLHELPFEPLDRQVFAAGPSSLQVVPGYVLVERSSRPLQTNESSVRREPRTLAHQVMLLRTPSWEIAWQHESVVLRDTIGVETRLTSDGSVAFYEPALDDGPPAHFLMTREGETQALPAAFVFSDFDSEGYAVARALPDETSSAVRFGFARRGTSEWRELAEPLYFAERMFSAPALGPGVRIDYLSESEGELFLVSESPRDKRRIRLGPVPDGRPARLFQRATKWLIGVVEAEEDPSRMPPLRAWLSVDMKTSRVASAEHELQGRLWLDYYNDRDDWLLAHDETSYLRVNAATGERMRVAEPPSDVTYLQSARCAPSQLFAPGPSLLVLLREGPVGQAYLVDDDGELRRVGSPIHGAHQVDVTMRGATIIIDASNATFCEGIAWGPQPEGDLLLRGQTELVRGARTLRLGHGAHVEVHPLGHYALVGRERGLTLHDLESDRETELGSEAALVGWL